jgi:HSP20 family molecular chaperone IbpA
VPQLIVKEDNTMLMPSIFGESLFDEFFNDDFMRPETRGGHRYMAHPAASVMKTDIKETENSFELDIDLPGYKKEDVSAELKDGYMTITAQMNHTEDQKDEEGNYIRRERYNGSCSRSFYVGEDITEEDIKARFEDGILKICVPKKEAKEEVPEKKFIAIEG